MPKESYFFSGMSQKNVSFIKKSKPHKDAVLAVGWYDITSLGGEWHKAKKEPKLAKCYTVGWVVRWEPYLVIGASKGYDGEFKMGGDRTAIPWGCVYEFGWLK